MILYEGIEDVRQQAGIALQGLCQTVGGGLAHVAVGVVEFREDLLLGEKLALSAELERAAQRGDGLVEEAHKGGAAGVGLFVEYLLFWLSETVRLPDADLLQIMA